MDETEKFYEICHEFRLKIVETMDSYSPRVISGVFAQILSNLCKIQKEPKKALDQIIEYLKKEKEMF